LIRRARHGTIARLSKLIRALPFVNAAALVVLGLSARNLPKDYWANKLWLILVAIVVSAFIPVILATIAERGEKARRQAAELEIDIQPHLTACLLNLVRHGVQGWEKIGVQAFRVQRRGWTFRQQHVRLAKIRMIPIYSSNIGWTKGKGVMGRCWETHAPQFIDMEDHFRPHLTVEESRWGLLTAEQRLGLTFREFQQVRGKYGIVAAAPMAGRTGRYLGCVTADAPPGVPLPEQEVLENLVTAAYSASIVLQRMR
jgi:hypothetical protein